MDEENFFILEVNIMKTKHKVLIAATAVLTLGVIIAPKKDNPLTVPKSAAVCAATEADRADYFASHGWEVEEICSRSITIPENFSPAYEEYAMLQDKQGMPIREYAGKEAEIYVFEVKNYSPDSKKMLAELLVCNDTAVASMVYSEDGGALKMAVS